MTPKPQGKIVRFAGFEVWLQTGELFKAGHRLRLQERAFRLLAVLVERPGEMVTREELRSRIWPGETYGEFDSGLNVAVHRLRACLGDSAEAPRFVETMAGRGYRFIAELQPSSEEHVVGPVQEVVLRTGTVAGRLPSWRVALSVAVVLVVALTGVSLAWDPADRDSRKVVAVLPLHAAGAGPHTDDAGSFTYALIAALSDCGSLRVVSATSSARYRNSGKPLREIARELDADAVVEGSLVNEAGAVSLTAHLIEAAHDRSLWGGHFERKDLGSAQSRAELATVVARNVKLALLRPGERPTGETGTFFPKPRP